MNALMDPSVTVRFRRKSSNTKRRPAIPIGIMSVRYKLEHCLQ